MALVVTDGATHDLTIREFAKETHTSERLVWSLVDRGEIRSYRLGRARRIPRGELLRLRGAAGPSVELLPDSAA